MELLSAKLGVESRHSLYSVLYSTPSQSSLPQADEMIQVEDSRSSLYPLQSVWRHPTRFVWSCLVGALHSRATSENQKRHQRSTVILVQNFYQHCDLACAPPPSCEFTLCTASVTGYIMDATVRRVRILALHAPRRVAACLDTLSVYR